MFSEDLERLRPIGLTAQILQQAVLPPADDRGDAAAVSHPCEADAPMSSPVLMRLTAMHRDSLRVDDGRDCHRAEVAARLTRLLEQQGQALAVGDWVYVSRDGNGEPQVVQRVEPVSLVTRRDAHGHRHPLVSNVDTALLTIGLDDDFSLRRIERYVSLVHHCGVRPVIVLTKADTVVNAQTLYARQRIVRERLGSDQPVLCVDARDPDAAKRLQPFTGPGITLVLLGSSGAGKSTLANTLIGSAVQDTGGVRLHDSRGKHTTRARSLFRLPQGGCIIDTPGLRALRADADEQAVAASFAEIGALAAGCHFRDCAHRNEPGCVVRETVDSDRLANYHKLLREARRDSISLIERRRQLAAWKARSRAQRERQRIEAENR